MTPTEEQLAITAAARETTDNLLVSALAGAAKTSTLVLVAGELRKQALLCLAFNKRIATEMKERLPDNCEAMTLNSLGHRVWASTVGRGLRVNTRKNYEILTELIGQLSEAERSEAYELFAETLRAIAGGKTAGYIPTGKFPNCKRLMDDDEFYAWLEDEPTPLQWDLIRRASFISISEGVKGNIDFDDQVFLPTVFPSVFPQYPVVLIDEAQDLSALNHAMLRKLARKRLIAVGDPCQAIYGFRGAHEDSMSLLEQTFSMRSFPLTMSFRCPQSVVVEAQWRAPAMRYPEWAKPGEVRTWTTWHASDLPQSAVILCRNNAPLFRMGINLLRAGRAPEIVGNDIGKMLIKQMKKLGKDRLPRAELLEAIDAWLQERLRKTRSPGSVRDQAECMRIFADHADDLAGAIAYAEHLFATSGPVKLMTVHKSKGLEFEDVFLLDRDLIRIDRPQEDNLLYVAQTRAKSTLTYITTDGFTDERQQES